MCLEFPAQNRFIIVFPLICGHFQNCTHELCPEEVIQEIVFIFCKSVLIEFLKMQRHHIRERSLSVVNVYLEEMAKEAKNIITTICDEQCNLSDRVYRYNLLVVNVHFKMKVFSLCLCSCFPNTALL